MFESPGGEQLDPALLAFVKCHVTSAVRWEVLRVLASHDGEWLCPDQLAHASHRGLAEMTQAVEDLAADGLVEVRRRASAAEPECVRLPADEPTSVVLHRLIAAATHSLELRAIIAAHLQHVRSQRSPIRTTRTTAVA